MQTTILVVANALSSNGISSFALVLLVNIGGVGVSAIVSIFVVASTCNVPSKVVLVVASL